MARGLFRVPLGPQGSGERGSAFQGDCWGCVLEGNRGKLQVRPTCQGRGINGPRRGATAVRAGGGAVCRVGVAIFFCLCCFFLVSRWRSPPALCTGSADAARAVWAVDGAALASRASGLDARGAWPSRTPGTAFSCSESALPARRGDRAWQQRVLGARLGGRGVGGVGAGPPRPPARVPGRDASRGFSSLVRRMIPVFSESPGTSDLP